jgi:hypothetical protein
MSKKSKMPHLLNLNEDPMLSKVVYHFLKGEKTTIGRKDASHQPDIVLHGLR